MAANSLSDFLEDSILDLVLRGVPYTGGANIYVALFNTPTDDGSGGVEVVGGSYTRVIVGGFDPPTSGVTTNSSTVQFPTATASWGTLTHMALYDAIVGGNRLCHGPLTVPKPLNAGDTFSLPPGNITVSMD